MAVTRRFRVDEFTDDGYVWLKLLEGKKKGLDFVFPVRHGKYSDELQHRISRLREDDVIEATVVSENERNTKWRFQDFDRVRKTV